MFGLFKKTETLNAPVSGKVIPITEVQDEVFSQKMMGDGFAIQPNDNAIYSPADGEIVQAFKTKHALVLRTNNGIELLLHVGLDTVELKGEGLTIHVTDGQKVKAGAPLITADFEHIKSQGKGTDVIIVLMNPDKMSSFDVTYADTAANEPVCKIKLK
ncbi:PTS glucose transporter subunit IIA [Clostridiales bacterium COT073_COT-073]|nr:PTS glucose transporter subunit IIA [Clostridiales bacterium COT073_COT-073]